MAPIRCASNTCTARAFVQLAKRRYGTTTSTSSSFDFLVPRKSITAPTLHSSTPRISISRITSFSNTPRLFSTSSARQATVCIRNPQQDEDGNDMMLEITPRAAKRLNQIMAKDKNPNLALRIQVESGGCHGFQYIMSLITIPSEGAEDTTIIKEDDSIFQFVSEDSASETAQESSPKIILDEPSLDLLKGSKVDFTQELIGSQFKIIDNPLATSSCGCGTSFDIKM